MKAAVRVISALVAVIMILSVVSVTVLATDTEVAVREIRISPSAADPRFILTDTEDVTYEWYEISEDDATVTDANASANYDAEYSDGRWYASFNSEINNYTFFKVELHEGDRIVVVHGREATNLDYGLYDGINYVEFQVEDSNSSYAEVDEEGYYYLILNPAFEDHPIEAYVYSMEDGVKLEGQSTDTLTEYEIGKGYYAKAIYGDGEVLCSDMFLMKYAIISQPTGYDISVSTNSDGDVDRYSWYYFNTEKEYTVIPDPARHELYVYEADFEDGLWVGSYINIDITGVPGDVIYVEPIGDFYGDVCLYDGSDIFKTDLKGRYYYELTDENDAYCDFEINSGMDEYSYEIYIMRDGERIDLVMPDKGVIDESEMKLYCDDAWACYYDMEKWVGEDNIIIVRVTVNVDDAAIRIDGTNGVVIDMGSDQIIEAEDGLFPVSKGAYEINISAGEGIAEAELFLVVGNKEYEIAQQREGRFDNEGGAFYVNVVENGAYKDGVWFTNEEHSEIDFEMDISKGEILTVVTSEEFDGRVTLDVTNLLGLEIELIGEGGIYTFVADKYYKFDLELEYCDEEFSAAVTIERGKATLLEGETERSIRPNSDGKYYAEVIFEDGTVLRSGASEYFYCDHSGNENSLDCLSATECSVCHEELAARGHMLGEWALTKQPTLDECAEETRMCSACGKLETREGAKLEGVDPAVIFIIIGAGAAASGAALLIAYLILKKRAGI